MVVDTSVLIAVLLQEPQAARITELIDGASPCLLSAANLLEASIVIEGRKREAGAYDLDRFIYRSGIEIARQVWRRFGKGRHPAGLNYGDCFAYSLAKSRGLPLLFTGNDFSQTDI